MSKSVQHPSYIIIGKVVEPRALKGELKIFLLSGEASWRDRIKTLRLVKGPLTRDFKMTQNSAREKYLMVKLEGIDDRTEAEKWIGSEVFIEEKNLVSKPGEEIFLREILGFQVKNNDEVVGHITGFESNGSQDILVVDEKILIPLVKDFLIQIDSKNKVVLMSLPPGLIEVNL